MADDCQVSVKPLNRLRNYRFCYVWLFICGVEVCLCVLLRVLNGFDVCAFKLHCVLHVFV